MRNPLIGRGDRNGRRGGGRGDEQLDGVPGRIGRLDQGTDVSAGEFVGLRPARPGAGSGERSDKFVHRPFVAHLPPDVGDPLLRAWMEDEARRPFVHA